MWKKSLFALTGLMIAACTAPAVMTGQWVQPIPGMENQKQGFRLEEGGKASSVNMATLQYESWRQEGETLVLSGQSIGNGQTIRFQESYHIKKLTPQKLILSTPAGNEFSFSRL